MKGVRRRTSWLCLPRALMPPDARSCGFAGKKPAAECGGIKGKAKRFEMINVLAKMQERDIIYSRGCRPRTPASFPGAAAPGPPLLSQGLLPSDPLMRLRAAATCRHWSSPATTRFRRPLSKPNQTQTKPNPNPNQGLGGGLQHHRRGHSSEYLRRFCQ